MDKNVKEAISQAERQYPGADNVSIGNKKVSKKLVDEETKMLNNNPKNSDL